MKKIWLLILMLILPISVYAVDSTKEIYVAWKCRNDYICYSYPITVNLNQDNIFDAATVKAEVLNDPIDIEAITCYGKQDCSVPDYVIFDKDVDIVNYYYKWSDFISFVYSDSLTLRVHDPYRYDNSKNNNYLHVLGSATSYNPLFGPSSPTIMSDDGNRWFSYTWSGKTVADFQSWHSFTISSCPNTADYNYNNNNCVNWTQGGENKIVDIYSNTNAAIIDADTLSGEKTIVTYEPLNTTGANDTASSISLSTTDFNLKIEKKEEQQPEQQPSLTVYRVLDGDNQIYDKASTNELKFRYDLDYSKYLVDGKIYVDDKEVDKSNYTSSEGSTIITFTKAFADSLSLGNHTVSVRITNGYATANFTVVNNPVQTPVTTPTSQPNQINPYTLDNINNIIILLVISVVAIVGIIILKKRLSK